MPLRTEYIEFEAEIESLQADMEDAADRLAEMDEDTPERLAAKVLQEGRDAETYINFLQSLTEGEAANMPAMEGVELAGLTSGELDLVDDIVEKHSNMRRRHAWVAVATQGDAPYLAHDPSEPLTVEACEESAMQVADLPRPFVEWCEERIGELSHLSESRGNGFLELASAKKTEAEE
jgi:hypothetical protein